MSATSELNRRLLQLLSADEISRDPAWHSQVLSIIPMATFQGLESELRAGSSGFPCLHLLIGAGAETDRGWVDVVEAAVQKSAGLMIDSGNSRALEFSFGMLATYKMFTSWKAPDGWSGANMPTGRQVTISPTRIRCGAPNHEYLPSFVRKALREHLLASGIPDPRVLLVVWPDCGSHRDLLFNVDRDSFYDARAYEDVMRSIGWYLPAGYSWATLDVRPAMKDRASRL